MPKTIKPKASDQAKRENRAPYAYFVSYAGQVGNSRAEGHLLINRATPITDVDTFTDFYDSLHTYLENNNGIHNPTIVSLTRLDNHR